MILDVPYLGFFLVVIWAIFVIIVGFWALNLIRGILISTARIGTILADLFMGLMDIVLLVMWFLILLEIISFLLLESTFQQMFTLIFSQLLPAYITFLAVKFAVFNLANRVVEVEASA